MPFQIHLLRLGRIYKPKFDIILYQNFKLKAKLGVVYPLKQATVNTKQVKVVSLYMEKLTFWVDRGLLLPKWLQPIYDKLNTPSLYQAGIVQNSPHFLSGLVNGKTIYSGNSYKKWSKNPNFASPRLYPTYKGKYVIRHWIRMKKIEQESFFLNLKKNKDYEKNSAS